MNLVFRLYVACFLVRGAIVSPDGLSRSIHTVVTVLSVIIIIVMSTVTVQAATTSVLSVMMTMRMWIDYERRRHRGRPDGEEHQRKFRHHHNAVTE